MKKFFIILILLLLTGCWNYKELNNCAIVNGISIDYEDNEYLVTFLFSNGKEGSSFINGKGKTIYEAMKNISLSSPKEIYIAHLSVLIISDEVARNGVSNILDYLLREPESNQNFYLVISKDVEAKKILTTTNTLSDYPSQNISSIIKTSEKEQARIINSDFNIFVSNLLKKGINPVANTIILNNNKPMLDSLAIFKEDKLIDYTNTEESIGINMLRGNVKKLYIPIDIDNNNVIITCNKYKIKKKYKNNKIYIDIYSEGIINEVENNIKLDSNKTINNIEKEVIDKMYSYTSLALQKSKECNTDIIGFGNLIYKTDYKYYNSINNWDNELNNLDIEINVKFNLTNLGSLKESIGELSYEK